MYNIFKKSQNDTPVLSQKPSTGSIDSYIRQDSTKAVSHKGKIIGHFAIGEKLGEGTFSKVCIGTHILTQEKVYA
jgi:hypothetical protein